MRLNDDIIEISLANETPIFPTLALSEFSSAKTDLVYYRIGQDLRSKLLESNKMKKLLTLIILLLPLIFLEGCSKSKQEVFDKCLAQVNQTFPTDLPQKNKLFQSCMAEHKYAFNPHSCDQSNKANLLSEICYVKY